jgi:DNA-binding IclR family transcriptional regulator
MPWVVLSPHTITDPDVLLAELARVRRDGHAVDEGEQEIGVRCVAVPVPGVPSPLGISVSGPAPRMSAGLVARAVPLLHQAADRLSFRDRGALDPLTVGVTDPGVTSPRRRERRRRS